MEADLTIRQMTKNDEKQVKQIIDLSFPKFYPFFAAHSLTEEGQVLICEVQTSVAGFAKLIDFLIIGKKLQLHTLDCSSPKFPTKGHRSKINKRCSSASQAKRRKGSFCFNAKKKCCCLISAWPAGF